MTKKYYHIEQFLGAYFHQDWDLDGESWEDVVSTYLANSDQNENSVLSKQLNAFIQDIENGVSDGNALLSDFGCYYNFDADGMSAIEWLSGLLKSLEK